MTSFMNVIVTATATRYNAVMDGVRSKLARTNAEVERANKMDPMGRRHLTSLMKFGNQLQWTGRMIQYNFTLPLALAAGAATKWQLENEKAFVHVQKVYGDTGEAAKQFRRENHKLTQEMAENKAARVFAGELDALRKSFVAISNHYGVQQKEVLEVAGAWAAAGASGLDLAKSVDATMKAIIIGDMNAAQATKALISIQAQYNLNSKELSQTLAILNSVENATGASMQDLIVAFEKSAGVARTAGVSTQQLAAYVAALVPASGSAATAGNALKTIFSRLLSPTKETVQVLEEMGLSMDDQSWKMASVSDQIQIMSDKFQGLSKKQQAVVATVAASRWQVNRFDILMKELNSELGFYSKALSASEDAGENFRRMQKELNTVLESDPRRLQRMWVMLQNASADIIQPLIPYIIYLAQTVANLVTAFSNLDPELQKLILFGAVFLAMIGPIIRYMGALGTLFGVLGFAVRHTVGHLFSLLGVFKLLFKPFMMLGSLLTGFGGLVVSSMKPAGVYMLRIVGIFMGGLQSMSIAFGVWQGRMAALWAAATAQAATRWGAMWLILKAMSVRGFAQIAAMSMIAPVVAVFTRMRALIVLIWAGQWTLLKSAAVAAWVQLHAVSLAGSAAQVGIFGKLRTAVIVIFTTMSTAVRTIFAGMAATMVVLAGGAATGVVGVFKKLAVFMVRFGKYLVTPWGLAFLAIVGLTYAFRDQITQIWRNIQNYFSQYNIGTIFERMVDVALDAFYRLPQGVQNAMIAVVTVVRDAALAVYEWFSYLNPFARHSPSLVDNVNRGVDAINSKFQQLNKTRGILAAVYGDIKKFSNATRNLDLGASAAEQKDDRKAIRKAGGGAAAVAAYDRLQNRLKQLGPLLASTEARMNAQERVVDRWQHKLDQANKRLEEAQDKLQRLQDRLAKWQDKLDEANSRLDYFASAPLKGMRAMEDQIFANTMAQTRLRYEMLQFEKVNGTFDDMKSKMEAINGLQEIMRGEQAGLRSAGAGSEILGQYDAEIQKLDEQKVVYGETFDKLNAMRLELDRLQQQAEELDLVKALKFDELQYQIDRTADQTKELSFEEIISGIQTAQGDIAKYTEKVNEAAAAVREQEGVVAEAEKARDRIQERLDKEQATLDRITERYNNIKEAIDAINSAISDVVANAEKMNDALDKKKKDAEEAKKKKKAAEGYMSPGLENFLAAEGANYPDPGGSGMPPRTDWSSQAKDIEKWTDKLADKTANMFANVNPFKSLREKAEQAWDWIVDKAKQAKEKVTDFFSQIFEGVDFGGAKSSIRSKLEPVLGFMTDVFDKISGLAGAAWDLLGPDIKKIGRGIWDGLKDIWERVGPELEKFKDLWGPIGETIGRVWEEIEPALTLIVGGVLGVIEVALSIVSELIDPVFDFLGDLLTGIIKIIRGVIEIIGGLVTGDLTMVKDGIIDLFSGLWDVVWGIFKFGARLVWNVVEGFVKGVVDFFVWLWDQIEPKVKSWWGDIKDAWSNIKNNVTTWWTENVWHPLKEGITGWWSDRKAAFGEWWGDIKDKWSNIKDNVKSWWLDNVWTPVKNGVTEWWGNRKADFAGWWEDIKNAWNNITSRSWWHDNVWGPIANGISEWWGNRLADFRGWWASLKEAWSNLVGEDGVGGWWKKNVTDKIYEKVTGVWEDIKKYFTDNPNLLKNAIKPVVNGVIGGINTIIKGLNKVSDVLPGDLWNITTIPEMDAQGTAALGLATRRANRGMKTTGARAIVGEGKANHPEFVIPTDPTYRHRARSLLAMAAQKIGVGSASASIRNSQITDQHGIPQYGIGGWLADKWDDTKNLGKKIANLPKKVVSATMDKVLDAAAEIINKVGYQPVESPPEYGISKLRGWVTEFDDNIAKKLDSMVPAGGSVPVASPSSPGGHQYWGGGLFTRKMVAHMEKAEELAGSSIHVMQGGFRPATSYSGTSHQGDALDMQVNYPLLYALRRVGIASGDRTGLGDWDPHIHAIPGPSAGYAAGSAVWQWQDYLARGGASQSPTSPWGLKYGAIVRKRTGGTLVRAGEAGQDEAIIPLPNGMRDSIGGRVVNHFYGATFEFPNVRTGEDAEDFLNNLEIIAGE